MTADGKSKPLIYLILGAANSGRGALIEDLIEAGAGEGERAAVLTAASETASDDLPAGLGQWRWEEGGRLSAAIPEEATHIFFVTDGRANPVDQIEAFKNWLAAQDLELARVLCIVDCRLAAAHPQLLAWYDACIHFSDVVLLTHREGVANKWMSDFQARYREQRYPCLFELVRENRVRNPALTLEPRALRISHVFDEEQDWTVVGASGGEDEDSAPEGEEEVEVAPEQDPYFERLNGGRRVKELPDIGRYLSLSTPPPPTQTPSPLR